MIRLLMVTLFGYLVVLSPLYAQEQNNLEYLWKNVEKNYPGIYAKDAAIKAAAYQEKAVKSSALPQAKLQAQNAYGTFEGANGAFFPQQGFFNVSGNTNGLQGSSTTSNIFTSGTVEWEVFSFGKQAKENKAAAINTLKAGDEKAWYLVSLKKELTQRYIQLLYFNAQLEWSERNANRLEEIKNISYGLAKAGLKPAADSLLAMSSYIQALGENDNLQGSKNAAFIRLSELNGSDRINYSNSAKNFLNPNVATASPNPSATNEHPYLQVLDRQIEYNEITGDAIQRAALPSVKLLGGYAYRGSGINNNGQVSGAWKDGFNNTTNNYLFGVGLTWNLSNLHTNRLKKESHYKEAESRRHLYKQQEQRMQATLMASVAKIEEQRKQLKKTTTSVKYAQDAYNMYLARYKSGLITLSELLQIRLLLEQAENNHIKASHSYWMNLASEAELTMDFQYLFNNL